MKILVDKDWGSSSLWIPGKLGGWASCDHHSFDLPTELKDRCDYFSDWYETYEPGSNLPEPDWEAYSAYKLALAIDIKRHFGNGAQVFIWKDNKIVEVVGDFSHMTCSLP